MQKITDQIWWEMPNKIQNSERMQPRKWGTNFGISTNISRTTVREASASRRHIAKSGHHWNSSNTTDNIVPGGFRRLQFRLHYAERRQKVEFVRLHLAVILNGGLGGWSAITSAVCGTTQPGAHTRPKDPRSTPRLNPGIWSKKKSREKKN